MIRAIVVDDELPSLNRFKKQLEDSGTVMVQGSFTGSFEALAYLRENKADAAFLDIEMPDIDGIELASRILDLQGNIAIVFVTAYNEYAVEAFRLNALDYLLKPVSADRLQETLSRIIDEKGMTSENTGLDISCFGKFCVKAGDVEIKFRTEKAAELLAYLISKKGCFVGRREIIDSLWEDFEGDRAIIHFNTTLHYLKKALLNNGVEISVQFDKGSYKLEIKNWNSNYIKFCTFIESAGAVKKENILEYEEIADLFKGDYLLGWECEWAERKRQQLEEQLIEMLLKMSEYYITTNNYGKAIKCLKKGLLHEPIHRELNYKLVQALLLNKDHLSAVKYYNTYKNGIKKKLKQEPDPEFRKLLT